MAKYERLAEIYDQLSEHDYQAWTEYLMHLIGPSETMVDAGCGTGSITAELAKKGIRMTGIDLSADMLGIAGDKARKRGVKINFSLQDICHFQVHSQVDAVISTCDTINYILTPDGVKSAFSAAYEALKDGGKYVFDVLAYNHMRDTLGEGFYGADLDEYAYIWQNTFDEDEQILNMDITFFVQREEETYERFIEIHRQRAYETDELVGLLEEVGFEQIRVYDAFTEDAPNAQSTRLCFVAEKPLEMKG